MFTLNGLPTDVTYGVHLSEAPGWRDAPSARYGSAVVPGRPGAVLLSDAPDDAPRTLTLRCLLRGTSAADARSKLDALVVALRAPGGVTVSFPDDPTREYVGGICERLILTPGPASMLAREFVFEIPITFLDPYARSTTATAVMLSGTPAPLPLGTAPVRPVITLVGGTNPTLTLKDHLGVTIGSMAIALALAGGTLVIDCEAATIRLNGANQLAALTTGDFFTLDPAAHADYAGAAWPTLVIGWSAAGSAQASYRRRWR